MACGCGATTPPIQSAGKKPQRKSTKSKKGGGNDVGSSRSTRSSTGTVVSSLNKTFGQIAEKMNEAYKIHVVPVIQRSVYPKNEAFATDGVKDGTKDFVDGMKNALTGFDIRIEIVPKCTMTGKDLPSIGDFKVMEPNTVSTDILSLHISMCKIIVSLLQNNNTVCTFPIDTFEIAKKFADDKSPAKYEFAHQVILILLKGAEVTETQKIGHFWYVLTKLSKAKLPELQNFKRKQNAVTREENNQAVDALAELFNKVYKKESGNNANSAVNAQIKDIPKPIDFTGYTTCLKIAFHKFMKEANMAREQQVARQTQRIQQQTRNAETKAKVAANAAAKAKANANAAAKAKANAAAKAMKNAASVACPIIKSSNNSINVQMEEPPVILDDVFDAVDFSNDVLDGMDIDVYEDSLMPNAFVNDAQNDPMQTAGGSKKKSVVKKTTAKKTASPAKKAVPAKKKPATKKTTK